jgi:hypothetical protein
MSMAGFLELIDNTLGTHFNAPVYDPAKGRAKLVKAIDGAATQHGENRTKVPNRAWTVGNNNAIRYKPTLNGHPILIGDKEENYVPSERFGDFLSGFKAAVQAGEFDDQIESALTNASSTPARGTGSLGGGRGRAATAKDDQHPKFTDPKWSTYTAGQKIQKGLAYKRSQA